MGAMQEIALGNDAKKKKQQGTQAGAPMMTRRDFLQILKELPPEEEQRSMVVGARG